MITVRVRNGKIEEAIAIFTEKVKRSGVLIDYKERQEYKKPSEVKREKRKKALRAAKLSAK